MRAKFGARAKFGGTLDSVLAEPLRKTWGSLEQFIAECQPLAEKLEANKTTIKDRKAELKRLVEHAGKELDCRSHGRSNMVRKELNATAGETGRWSSYWRG